MYDLNDFVLVITKFINDNQRNDQILILSLSKGQVFLVKLHFNKQALWKIWFL